jgi:predicted DNA-binding transcriptional regulator AlpA
MLLDLLDLDPAKVPVEEIAAVLCQLGALQVQLAARLAPAPAQAASSAADLRLLTVEEAAAKLGVACGWLYRRAKRLGLAVKLDNGTLRFSSAALDEYIRRQTISAAPARRRRAA